MERTQSSASMRRKKSSKHLLQYSAQALSQFVLLATTLFITLAVVGGSVQVYRLLEHGNYKLPSFAWFKSKPGEESLSSLAISTTLTAISLWGRLLLSVVIPATDHSLVFAKEGWVALEPSLRQTSLWFVYDTSPAFKLGVFSFLGFAFAVWLLERELQKRQISQRLARRVGQAKARLQSVSDWFHFKYSVVKDEVAQKSKVAAMLLPHVLYVVACVTGYMFVGDIAAPLSRGFAAWFVTIGIPVGFGTQKLLQYDAVCRERLRVQQPDNANLSSDDDDGDGKEDHDGSEGGEVSKFQLPITPRSEYMESAILSVRKRFLSDASLTSPMHDTYGVLTADTVKDFDPVLAWLRYFAVLSVCLLWEQFPVTGHFLGLIPVWPEIRLAFSLWLQLPITRGCDWAFLVIVPFLDKYVKKLPLVADRSTGLLQQTEQHRGLVITLLSSLGLVSKKTGKKLLKATEANGNVILLSIPFLLSPTFVTKIGVLVVGLAFPAQASTTCILEIEHFKQRLDLNKKNDGNGNEVELEEDAGNSGEQSVFWLEYWIVYVLFSLLHGAAATVFGWWFPLWDQMHLIMLLWMQITYFSGAHHVFNTAVVIARVYRKRRRALARAVAATRRKSRLDSVATPQEKIDGLMVSMLPSSMLPPRLSIHMEEGRLISDEEEEEEDEKEGAVVASRRESSVAASRRESSAAVSRRESSAAEQPPQGEVEEEATESEQQD
ncbi:hypothetical protein BASA81_002338 [Batrachochytrium salamandrivorans]|nr:hypothetical protein BASA81_002338 [Batrachochytrium salamandrivorans]